MIKKRHNQPYLFVASGSGGHIIPILTLAQQLKTKKPAAPLHIVSEQAGKNKHFLDAHQSKNTSFTCHYLSLMPIPYNKKHLFPLFFIQLIISFFRSLLLCIRLRPAAVITTGGYLSLPVFFAARIVGFCFKVRLVVYEFNKEIGKANKVLLRIAHILRVCFTTIAGPLQKQYNHITVEYVPYPLRFTAKDRICDFRTCIDMLNHCITNKPPFSLYKKTLLILGGSQGSLSINKAVVDWVQALPIEQQRSLQIIHQAGPFNKEPYDAIYTALDLPHYVFSYDPTLHYWYSLADLVVSRAGAGTLFELAFFNKKAIIIPHHTKTTAHQQANALALAYETNQKFTVLDCEDEYLSTVGLSLFSSTLETLHPKKTAEYKISPTGQPHRL